VSFTGWYTPAVGDTLPVTTKVPINNLIPSQPKHDYDAEVLTPLHQAQARQEALSQAAEQARLRQVELDQSREVQAAQPVVATQPTGNCATWLAQAGVTDVGNAMWIITRESGCNPWAVNASSGAEGIAQALPYSKTGCAHGDAVCQVNWMQGYVNSRYGSWAGAVNWWRAHNWY
jgi:hypothetical protein